MVFHVLTFVRFRDRIVIEITFLLNGGPAIHVALFEVSHESTFLRDRNMTGKTRNKLRNSSKDDR